MIKTNSFYLRRQLYELGLKDFGKNVLISKKASLYSPEKISIGDNVRIDDFCILSGSITLGSYIHISAYTAMYGGYGYPIIMEDFTGLSARCTVYSMSDDFGGDYLIGPMLPHEVCNVQGGPVIIKKYTQVGANCVILPNVTLGEGVSVGSMSLVNKSLDDWGIYVGIPAKKLKDRSKGLLKFVDQFKH